MKKSVLVVAVFLAGVLGGGTAALAFSQSEKEASVVPPPCPVDWTCRDARGRCIACPDQ